MTEPIKDLGTLIDELIAIRIQQAFIMDSASSAFPKPALQKLEDEAVTIRMKIASGQFRPWGAKHG